MSTPEPRVRPGGRADTGLAVQVFARLAARMTGSEPPAIFLTLGRHRRLFWRWLLFASALMPGGRLPRRESELVILRVATLTDSLYEQTQHRVLGRRAGLSVDEIDRVARGPLAGGWSDRDDVLLCVADALHADGDVDDALWSRMRATLDDRECIELVMLVGHYTMLASVLRTLRVQPDRLT